MISFTIVDYYIMQFDNFIVIKTYVGSKAFFTMATLLMPLLENARLLGS